jgi:hypothetical protein
MEVCKYDMPDSISSKILFIEDGNLNFCKLPNTVENRVTITRREYNKGTILVRNHFKPSSHNIILPAVQYSIFITRTHLRSARLLLITAPSLVGFVLPPL